MSEKRDAQREVTRIALSGIAGFGFALAGSGAIREHVDDPLAPSSAGLKFGLLRTRRATRADGEVSDAVRSHDRCAEELGSVHIDTGLDDHGTEAHLISHHRTVALGHDVSCEVITELFQHGPHGYQFWQMPSFILRDVVTNMFQDQGKVAIQFNTSVDSGTASASADATDAAVESECVSIGRIDCESQHL